ncbi:uncharacterized protein LOC129602301 [Paramacrobiotus metropolitanus]|uniref:uncharacterized protein LOC129602301 n=1 Tax=Paramacrobiotus metropolitanus TaxID=2943436 RepID=UPI002445F51C|nr:uncharacterized protein LOC129602301 [Paramacrobiotus metropolitanus]
METSFSKTCMRIPEPNDKSLDFMRVLHERQSEGKLGEEKQQEECHTVSIPCRRIMAFLGLGEILLGFIMFAMQMYISMFLANQTHLDTVAGCDWPYCDVSFHLKFASATYILSIIAGCSAFLVAGENLLPRTRHCLAIFGVIYIVVNLIQTVLLSILKMRNVILGIALHSPTHFTAEEARFVDSLKTAMIAMVCISGALLLILGVLLLLNILQYRSKCTRDCTKFKKLTPLREKSACHHTLSGPQFSLMERKEVLKKPSLLGISSAERLLDSGRCQDNDNVFD